MLVRKIPLLLTTCLVLGCPGSTTETPDATIDLAPPTEGPVFPDGAPDLPEKDQLALVDQLIDQTTDGPGVDPCLAVTTDGMKLNPGCDLDFKANGPTAMGQFVNATTGNPAWLFVSGTKYWLFDPTAKAGQGAFTAGGKDIAAAVMALAPTNCTSLSPSGMPLNPGCDVGFQANGPTVVGTARTSGTTGVEGWLFTSGKKYWIYEPQSSTGGAAAFVAAGADVAAATMALQPTNCTATGTDGTPLNPGCDVGYQANGPTAWGEFSNTSTGAAAWLFVSGPKYWMYDPVGGGQGQFTAAGASLATLLASLPPACTAIAPDGTKINPGCDVTFQANGPTAVGEFRQPATAQVAWLFTSGKKFWLLDPTTLTFTAAGADISVPMRKLATQ